MVVHSVLPEELAAAVQEVLGAAAIAHAAHGPQATMPAAQAAAGDPAAVALIGPHRSADVAEALAATAPAGLPLLAPAATWAGVTRDDEPGCDDAPDHRGTVLRLVARDTVVAARIAADVAASGHRAHVVAGEHDYGRQLAAQLRLAGLVDAGAREADVIVLCGLAGEPEIGAAAALAPLPVIAFDGVQGSELVAGGAHVLLALPHAPEEGTGHDALLAGAASARRAARLVARAAAAGAADRAAMLAALRRLGPFDEHGDPVAPPVWLWRADEDWALTPERPI